MTAQAPRETWSLDREIVRSRVFAAPRDLVFAAWTQAEHIARWFKPKNFTSTLYEFEAKVGGKWRFDYRGPDGHVYPNRIVFLEIKAPELLVFDHGSDVDDDPNKFRVTVTFDEQDDKKTVVTMRQLHPTKTQRDVGVGFGAVEIGYGTLDNLALYLERL